MATSCNCRHFDFVLPDAIHMTETDDLNALPPLDAPEETPLVVVRYGLAKEIQLFPDALVFLSREEGDADRFSLASIRRLIMQPGEKIPSKLIVLLELDDGTMLIAGEGMTNVRDFRKLLVHLPDVAPHIQLDPPDMDAQLQQALANRRQTNLGCYGAVLAAALFIVLIFVISNLLSHR